jgi:hypothetical protein
MPLLPLPVERGEGRGEGPRDWSFSFLTSPLTLALSPQAGRGNG